MTKNIESIVSNKVNRKVFSLEEKKIHLPPAEYPDVLPELFWIVTPEGNEEESYLVDLHQLANGTTVGRPLVSIVNKLHPTGARKYRVDTRRISQVQLVADLAESIKSYTERHHLRTSFEYLSTLRWLFRFTDEYLHTLSPAKAESPLRAVDLNDSVGVTFANWLRQQPIGRTRMSGIYSAASHALTAALGRTLWRANPFSTNSVRCTNTEAIEYSSQQYLALLRLCKGTVAKFMATRKAALKDSRSTGGTDSAALTGSGDSMESDDKDQQGAESVRRSLALGMIPSPRTMRDLCLVPTSDFIAAAFMLVLIRTGVNEQPLLDIQKGQWLHLNPFGKRYRNIVLWKNRSGGNSGRKKPTRITVAVQVKPTFYPVKVIRYLELLNNLSRKLIEKTLAKSLIDNHFILAARRHKNRFWLFVDSRGEWISLDATQAFMSRFIAKNCGAYPELRDADGTPLRYSAKAIRNSYLEFSIGSSGFSIDVANQELGHVQDAASINNYLKRPWAINYAHQSHLKWQSAAFAVISSGEATVNPAAISKSINGKKLQPLATFDVDRLRPNVKVRHGLDCLDPLHPPQHIYKSSAEDDVCPAEWCFDCEWARCFKSSLPELAKDIINLSQQRDHTPMHLWHKSTSENKLGKLQELMSRWPIEFRDDAFEKAMLVDLPNLPYTPRNL